MTKDDSNIIETITHEVRVIRNPNFIPRVSFNNLGSLAAKNVVNVLGLDSIQDDGGQLDKSSQVSRQYIAPIQYSGTEIGDQHKPTIPKKIDKFWEDMIA